MSQIRAIFFDFDGLILDTEHPEFLSWCEVYVEHGCTLELSAWAEGIGTGASTATYNPYDALERLTGRPIDREAVRAAKRARFAARMASQPLLPGVEALLEAARGRGLRTALVSSSPMDWIQTYLPRYEGLIDRFDCIRCGDQVARAKPEPDLYLAALDALGLAPHEAIALEDSANGVRAAQRAGIYCVAVPNAVTRHTPLDHANLTVPSLAGLTLDELLAAAANSPRRSP